VEHEGAGLRMDKLSADFRRPSSAPSVAVCSQNDTSRRSYCVSRTLGYKGRTIITGKWPDTLRTLGPHEVENSLRWTGEVQLKKKCKSRPVESVKIAFAYRVGFWMCRSQIQIPSASPFR